MSRLTVGALVGTGLLASAGLVAGCGWSPGAGPQPGPDTCAAESAPTADAITQALTETVGPDSGWQTTAQGHTTECRLYWAQVAPAGADRATAGQVLFFDRNTFVGTPTPEPRPYTSVLAATPKTATVTYQWLVGADKECCPTGIGSVSFQIGDSGELEALDPIPQA